LIKAGGFDSLGHSRKGLFLIHTDAVDSVLGTKKAEAMGQFDLFGGADIATDSVFTIKVPDDEWDDKHKLAIEREMLGLYVSGHPLNGVAHLLAAQVDTHIPAILDGDVPNESQVRVGGILAGVERRVNKNGMPWASAQLEDLTGGIRVNIFAHVYSQFGGEIADDAIVLVGGKVRIEEDRVSLMVNDIVVPDFSNAQVVRPLAVSLPTRQCTAEKVSALKQILAIEASGKTEKPEYMTLLMPNWYEQHILRRPADQWPEPVIRAGSNMNRQFYVTMQGPSEMGARGRLVNWDRFAELKRIQVPTLVISGKYDTMDPAYMAQMAKQLPHGELAATNGGHMAMYDDQPNYFAKLTAFLRKLL